MVFPYCQHIVSGAGLKVALENWGLRMLYLLTY